MDLLETVIIKTKYSPPKNNKLIQILFITKKIKNHLFDFVCSFFIHLFGLFVFNAY